MSARKTVVIKKAAGYGDAGALRECAREILARAPFAGGISPDKRVVVKVNALMKANPDEAVTTHPAVVRAVIDELKALGARDIVIADSPSGPFTRTRLAGVYEGAGFAALAADGVRLLYDDEAVDVAGGGAARAFTILKAIADADIKIGVGKLKTHALTGLTGAVKLWLGAVPGLKKAELHCRFPDAVDFAEMLCSLYDAVAPDFNIIDAVEGMQGNGPSGGEKRAFGFIAGGADGYALDSCMSRALGVAPRDALTVAASIARGSVAADALSLDVEDETGLFASPLADLKLPDSFSGGRTARGGSLTRLAQSLSSPRPVIRPKDCVGCARCAEICPRRAIEIINGKAHISRNSCMRCFCCHEVCPRRAIDIKSHWFFRVMK